MSYRDLEIWPLARDAVVSIHTMSINVLPELEMLEEGSQIRRSVNSIKANIVGGCGCRTYMSDFIHHLTYAHASCDETIDHLETIRETGSLTRQEAYNYSYKQLDEFGRKLNSFIRSVNVQHHTCHEESGVYEYAQVIDQI